MAHWSKKYQTKCSDGGKHDGRLELMTWPGKPEYEDFSPTGWGGVFIEEESDHKQSFIDKYKSNEEEFFKYWPQGFRWTCCGMAGDLGEQGCDHHGTGSRPCQCDFCVMGKPLTDKIFNKLKEAQSAHGLTLSRGPDPRSYNRARAMINDAMRSLLGLDG